MSMTTRVGIIMGSDSDLPIMRAAADTLSELGVGWELTIVSAHRTPERLFDYARDAESRGLRVIIAGRMPCCRSCKCRRACLLPRWP